MQCHSRCRHSSLRKKIMTLLWTVIIALVIISLITPLRNALVPGCLWHASWNDVHTLKLLRIHITDLFYPIDRSPYTGSCAHILPHLSHLDGIKPDQLPVYSEAEWQVGLKKVKRKLSPEDVWKLEHFKPSLTEDEQRELLYSVLVVTQAFNTFNVTYLMAGGALIGVRRHHGLIPWEDDADLIVKASQWALAREILSCIPGFSWNMGWDNVCKFMWNRSKFWKDERVIRFPFVDVIPYNEDDVHIWPLTIWMKKTILWRTADAYPPQYLPLEGYHVSVARNASANLTPTYENATVEECASREFLQRDRVYMSELYRVQVPCSYLYDIYPFVFHMKNYPGNATPIQVRRKGGKVLSTFVPPVQ